MRNNNFGLLIVSILIALIVAAIGGACAYLIAVSDLPDWMKLWLLTR